MPNPAFIVDGHTEQQFINAICPGHPIRRTNLNGKSVTIDAIATKVASLIKLLGNRNYPIIILVDRETRKENSDILSKNLLKKLHKLGLKDQDIRIGFPDRMIENWIIADFKLIGKLKNKPVKTDGSRGSAIIKKNLGSYSKVIDGVELLAKKDCKIVYANSPSYKSFIDQLEGIECDYLKFRTEV